MDLLYALEKIRTPILDKFMSTVTHFGGEYVYLVLAIVVFWCISKKCGYYMLSVGFSGVLISQFLKIFCRIPRPWVKDPDFTIVESARADAGGYSFPSGHTQSVFASIGAPARYWKNTLFRVLAVIIIILTAFSRMYLGVHTPLDVGVSFACGIILVFVLYPLFNHMEDNPKGIYTLFFFLIVFAAAFVAFVELYGFPEDVDAENYAEALKNSYMLLFCSVGLLMTYYADRKYLNFTVDAVWWVQIIKTIVGIGIVLAIKAFLKQPLNALFNGHAVANGVRYFLIILFAGIVWPMTFKWFSGIGRRQKDK